MKNEEPNALLELGETGKPATPEVSNTSQEARIRVLSAENDRLKKEVAEAIEAKAALLRERRRRITFKEYWRRRRNEE